MEQKLCRSDLREANVLNVFKQPEGRQHAGDSFHATCLLSVQYEFATNCHGAWNYEICPVYPVRIPLGKPVKRSIEHTFFINESAPNYAVSNNRPSK